MISKRIAARKDGRSSARDALSYGEGLTPDRTTGELLDKSHRTRLGNFGIVDGGVYAGGELEERRERIELAAIEMQANCDLNTRVHPGKKLAHFVFSFNQDKPSEAVLRDTEDSMLAALGLADHHFCTFLHNDNGFWHLHVFSSLIEKGPRHRANPLWHDRIKRDQVCRQIETRHSLTRDAGLHRVDEQGSVVEVPRAERIAKRDAKTEKAISDRARTKEAYSGEQSFQSWCAEIRIGDRLKHAKSWPDLHAAAAAYGCQVRAKGAGFVICPIGEKGGIQLSKLGLKNLPAQFGAFVPSSGQLAQVRPEASYEPAPTRPDGAGHYQRWKAAKVAFVPLKTQKLNELRETHAKIRAELREQQKAELKQIRATTKGPARHAAVSVAKMEHVLALSALTPQFANDRQALRRQLNAEGPGFTYRDYLVSEAAKGDNVALGLSRRYGVVASTDVLRQREAEQLKIVAVVCGLDYRPAMRLQAKHTISRSGTVTYDLGNNRTLTDSAISKQVQLNAAAANSPEAVAVALRFAMSKFGNTLTLTGSPEWQRMAVQIAVRNRLPVKFADPVLESYRTKLAAQTQEKPRAKSRASQHLQKGAANVLNRNLDFHTKYDNIIHLAEHRAKLAAQRRSGLHELPTGGLDGRREGSEVLLPDALHVHLGDKQAGQDQDLRRAGAGESGSRRRDTAARITANQHISSGGERWDVPIAPAAPIQPNREAEKAPAPALPAAEQWLADNPNWRVQDDQRQSSGAVLYVAPDGFWIQKLGRGQAVAIRQPVDFPIQVGDVVDFKNGKATLARHVVEKGPSGPSR